MLRMLSLLFLQLVVGPQPAVPSSTIARHITNHDSRVSRHSPSLLLWPLPKKLDAAGRPLRLHWQFAFVHASSQLASPHPRLRAAMERYQRYVEQGMVSAQRASVLDRDPVAVDELMALRVHVVDSPAPDSVLLPTEATDYSYTLRINSGNASLSAPSVFGAIAGMESLVQLLNPGGGFLQLPFEQIVIEDEPEFPWRAVMLDTGRRFFPVPLVENLLDTMSAVKMSVLHLHASDYCRWSIESKRFPELTAMDATGTSPGYWTQAEVKGLVQYAADRGIRVVPEFDLPGHARAMLSLASSRGLEFCGAPPHQNQLKRSRRSLEVLRPLLGEMAALFPDKVSAMGAERILMRPCICISGSAYKTNRGHENDFTAHGYKVFNLGTDETAATSDCPQNATHAFERELVAMVRSFNKTVMGWESILLDGPGSAAAGDHAVIVDTYLSPARFGGDVKIIVGPPCLFCIASYECNMQGGVVMTLASTPSHEPSSPRETPRSRAPRPPSTTRTRAAGTRSPRAAPASSAARTHWAGPWTTGPGPAGVVQRP
jgi:hypothetical protein